MKNPSNVARTVSLFGGALIALVMASGTASASDANADSAAPRACTPGVALVSPAASLRGQSPVNGSEAAVLNVDANTARGVTATNGYAVRARAAVTSDVGRGNRIAHCAF